MLPRDHWQREIARLDADTDRVRITQILATHEFPWDMVQALSFALFRTYAVPSIGRLLFETGEFTERVQKRYDDTALLLEEILEHSLTHERGRAAVRRINQMHGHYDISDDDFRYVLATFVVMPRRWIDAYGYRPLTDHEVTALTNYYRDLGRHMGIPEIPDDYAGFDRLLDAYEAEHFGRDAGARAVADSTLALMTTFSPNNLVPARLATRASYSFMDEPLLDAFGFPRPRAWERRAVHAAMRARAALIARLPARRRPKWTRDFGYVRSYPQGCPVEHLGTFPEKAG